MIAQNLSTRTTVSRETKGPEWVCPYCGKSGCNGECGGRRTELPAQRVEIYQSADGWHWTHLGKRISRNVSSTAYPTALEAAMTGAVVAHCHGIPLRTGCNILNQDLVFAWQLQGIERAQKGEPFETCWNKYQRQGFLSVTQPQIFGWPEVTQ